MKLELSAIEKSFGVKHVLKGISLCAEGGKAFGLLGRNGAGGVGFHILLGPEMNLLRSDCSRGLR